jgi:acetyl esterase/lipase
MAEREPDRTELWSDPEPASTRTFVAPGGLYPNRTTRNVNRPTLTEFVAAPQTNDTAVIICPGGGMVMHAIEHEGWAVAEWFQAQGTSAYVLEYRLLPTTSDDDMQQQLLAIVSKPLDEGPLEPHAKLAGDDLIAAIRMVKQRHSKVVLIGFSAGARTAYEAIGGPPETRPDAIAFIYGPTMPARPLDDAPPAFLLIAADDPIGIAPVLDLFKRWRAADRPAELHVFERGSHGFGMVPTRTSTDGWIEHLGRWLRMHQLL